MSLLPEPLPPIPEATTAAVRAAFPQGNLYADLRTEFGTLYDDQLFADLYPPQGRPVEVAHWGLALVMLMQYIEGLTDRQAADAVRRCMDSTGPPVAPVPPVRCAPRRKTPHGNSSSGRKPTTRRSRPRAYDRKRLSSKPNLCYSLEWRVACRKASGALISVRVSASA
jgi:hypothetical protein